MLQQNFWLQQKKKLFVVPNFVAVTKPFFPCRSKLRRNFPSVTADLDFISCYVLLNDNSIKVEYLKYISEFEVKGKYDGIVTWITEIARILDARVIARTWCRHCCSRRSGRRRCSGVGASRLGERLTGRKDCLCWPIIESR